MKPKLIGILLLAVVVLAAGGYSFYPVSYTHLMEKTGTSMPRES